MKYIFDEAHREGMIAAEKSKATCPVMLVYERVDPLNDNSRITKVYPPVMGGPCGFAWVVVPGIGKHVRFAKGVGFRKHYPKGLSLWVGMFGQSMHLKEAYAARYAEILRSHGIDAYSDSRMD